MRLAVLLHVPTVGGVTRLTQALLDGLLRADPTLEIGLFLDAELAASGEFSTFEQEPRVSIVLVRDPSLTNSARDVSGSSEAKSRGQAWGLMRDILKRWPRAHVAAVGTIVGLRRFFGSSKPWYLFSLPHEIVRQFAEYDVVYLAFPYYLKGAKIATPCVGTFHDVNHKHFPQNFDSELQRVLDRGINHWLTNCTTAVVSTHFMERDLVAHYPVAREKTKVVYVAPYSHRPLDDTRARAVLTSKGLEPGSYALYPAGLSAHKNLAGFLRAADLIKHSGSLPHPRFVLTGHGTDRLGDPGAVHPFAQELNRFLESTNLEVGSDVVGLGYVLDEEVDALTRMAGLVCSTSLYEAGCGPALDAWQFGVPVAFSAIAPFLEQMEILGTSAWVFDPTNPQDIADTIVRAFENRARSREMAESSLKAIARYTWNDAARVYLEIFRSAAPSA